MPLPSSRVGPPGWVCSTTTRLPPTTLLRAGRIHRLLRRCSGLPRHTVRSANRPEPPAKNGHELGSTQEVHDQHHRGEPSHPGVPLSPPGIVPESDVRVHTPAAAAPQPEHGHVNEGLGELPWAYGDARLVGLVRDPTTLFIYWDFSQLQIEQAFAGLGSARAVIKLWNARNGGSALGREKEIHLEARGGDVREFP